MMEEVRLARSGSPSAATVEALSHTLRPQPKQETEIERSGSWEFASSRNPNEVYRVTFGRAGHLDCYLQGL